MGKITENRFTEEHLLGVASKLCIVSPRNILLIGGTLVLPSVSGYKRLRLRSEDIDCISNDEGLNHLQEKGFNLRYLDNLGCYQTKVSGVLIAFFHNHIREYPLTSEIFQRAEEKRTFYGSIYAVPPELNIALKIRRGIKKGKIYGKDGLDLASTSAGMRNSGRDFSPEELRYYLSNGICAECELGEHLKCMNELEKAVHNVPSEDKEFFRGKISECKGSLSSLCYHLIE
ncbi:hypothetical protein HYX15_00725 [Candidatus Woesearchaeota archaeon]|nr:hypothetical protein [Candidatus Woesearchaeota archaeon]